MEEILKMYESTFSDSNILRAAVGTNGFQGGDSSHGGRTFIELEDLAGTDIDFQVEKEGRLLKINLRGDAGLRTIMGALQFISRTLERETQGSNTSSQKWKSFLEFAKKRKVSIGVLLEHGNLKEWTDNSVLVEFPNKSFHFERMQDRDSREALDTLLSEFSGQPMKGQIVGKP